MTDNTTTTTASLQAAFLEVSFRANRLSEWTELEAKLLALEMRFNDFDSEARDAPVNMNEDKRVRLDRLWERCQDTELLDLQSVVNGVRYINRSSWLDNGDQGALGAAVLLKVDISSVIALIDPIQTSLDGRDWGPLVQNSARFRRELKAKLLNNRNLWHRELRELCTLTIQLSSALSGKFGT